MSFSSFYQTNAHFHPKSLKLHFLRLPDVVVYAFTSSLSSSTFSPHHCFRRHLRLHVRLVAFMSVSSSPSSPSRCRLGPLRLCFIVILAVLVCHHLVAFALHVRISPWIVALLTRWLPPRLRPIFFVACRDRPQWPSPQGALGNAPVGTSLC
ncbi:hypothetical protein OUZ56_002234 [Daphnia magna]|uniref:Transmembrane protein n=1 Tax=Daphnia magna TaxID=35525 RepID=A0ABR0A533_9CRUS|nr:hypothetical protein OUZ56_002234 [Daphnia magna]